MNLKDQWEQRASTKGVSLAGVLYRGLPEHLNEYIHEWHIRVLQQRVLSEIPMSGRVLDVGCGYGRISEQINKLRPDLEIVAVDLALEFCKLARKKVDAHVVCGDITQLPLSSNSFDAIVAVTSLMYVIEPERETVMKGLMACLKPRGVGLFVDPGREYSNIIAALKPSTKSTPTGGNWFSVTEYDGLGRIGGTMVVGSGGIPVFSLFVPLLMLLPKRGSLANWALRAIARMDSYFSRWQRLSIHRWMLLRRL